MRNSQQVIHIEMKTRRSTGLLSNRTAFQYNVEEPSVSVAINTETELLVRPDDFDPSQQNMLLPRSNRLMTTEPRQMVSPDETAMRRLPPSPDIIPVIALPRARMARSSVTAPIVPDSRAENIASSTTDREPDPLASNALNPRLNGRSIRADGSMNSEDSDGDGDAGQRLLILNELLAFQGSDHSADSDRSSSGDGTELGVIAARIVRRIDPQYPGDWASRGMQGDVILLVTVGTSGAVEVVELLTSSGFDALDESAISAVKQWRYTPATQNGEAIRYTGQQTVRFLPTSIP